MPTLQPRAPFSFKQTLRFISDFTPAMGEQQVGSSSLTKAVSIGQRPVVFSAEPADDAGVTLGIRVSLICGFRCPQFIFKRI